jgi:Flp pilus assembly protein TadG
MRRLLVDFVRQRGGNIAILFAFTLIPILIGAGIAVDYGRALLVRTNMQNAADSAALALGSWVGLSQSDMQTKAQQYFNANYPPSSLGTVGALNLSFGANTITVSVSGSVKTTFLNVANIDHIDVGATNTVTSPLTYVNFYLLLDNTPSMGVGATTSDINTMVAHTPDQCAFACHDLSTYPNDYYSLAKKLGVQMRIDVMRTATQQLMDTASTTESFSGQFGMAIYTYGSSAKTAKLTTIQSLTTSLSGAQTAASAIDLMTVPYQNYVSDTDTDNPNILSAINSVMPNPGDGSSPGQPLEFLFFVSDGVSDRAIGSPGCSRSTTIGQDPQTNSEYVRCQEPIDVDYCTTIKNRGIKIAVLYTTYLPLPTNSWYNTWIAPFQSTIATNMQNCASPDLYFEVSPTQGIAQAMNQLFQQALQEVRLVK